MKALSTRLTLILAAVSAAQMLSYSAALAHTGDDAAAGHIVVEFGQWAVGAAAVLGLVVLVFWIRAKALRR